MNENMVTRKDYRKLVELDSVVFWVQEIGCSTLIDLLDVKQ